MGTSKNPAAFVPKDRVDHSVYGLGTVVTVNERHTTIMFDAAGVKKFMTAMVELTRSDTPAPKAPGRQKKEAARSH